MSAWKKGGAVLILIGTALFLGLILTACDSMAAPEKPAAPASQGVPSESEKEAEKSDSSDGLSVAPAENSLEPAKKSEESASSEESSVSQDERLDPVSDGEQTEVPNEEFQEETAMKMQVQVGDLTFTATLENNPAADALVEMMKAAPVEIQMSDYSGFEKIGPLGQSLPAEDRQTTTRAGDIVLYTGNQIVMFYGSNSWSYTRLGHIDDLTGWAEALGSGDVTVRFSLAS